ncbi:MULTISPECIES: hypothetical protein [Rhizobium]|uniref:Secreted protein n=1 Tax=Rhizobium favelukesii TaxID=348824 RepID=W6R787_9HYPH|nr:MULTISPECIES: hypothetical protein [Rhizobium]MCA0800494.1 hypothetical protein [Rhizobium sp. T1473]MCS0461624.1 hypothetical protein [Rhizobium favelukesii]UFS82072.1 hypothetical protein LPB79_27950 [Rhizobium sp. T136]CDM56255.1 hypothetical protein LPU83_0573 [Rhizobium favelukesii]
MRKTLMNCTVAAMALCSVVAPAMADSVTVTREHSDDDYDRVRPGITINEHGIRVGALRDRDRYYRDRCYTKTVTTMTDDGDEVTKTVRRCR